MEIEQNIRFHIQEVYTSLRTSEKKVADYILGAMDKIDRMSLVELSDNAKVSQPTIIRFVKALGYSGFKEFKYEVVAQLGKERKQDQGMEAMYGYPIKADDSLDKLPSKTIAKTMKMMEDSLKCISLDSYKEVIELITKANMIDIYGVENSSTTVSDLTTKLLYLGLNARSFQDIYLQRICASNLSEQDVAIGISYSGCSKDTVDIMKTAKKSGARTIIITNFKDTLISKYADVVLCTTHEKLLYGDAIFSRASQLALVDMIYMGIILSDYDRYIKKLDKNSRLISDKIMG